MGAVTPLKKRIIEKEGTQKSSGESGVMDDTKIYNELIAPLEKAMMRSIWRIVRDADLAEDSLQDALAVIWKKRFSIIQHPNPPALVLKICLDAAYDSLRSLDRRRKRTDLSKLDCVPEAHRPTASQSLEEREVVEQMQRAIRRLPRKRALAVMMRLIHEESFETISRALDCSEVTVTNTGVGPRQVFDIIAIRLALGLPEAP